MKEIKGDLIKLALDGHFDIIVHGANCFCKMKSGIAKVISETFPEVVEEDNKTTPGDFNKLGNYTSALVKNNNNESLFIINAYSQYNYGTDTVKIDYDALTLCLKKINHNFRGKTIGLPLIGCGLAGGDWNIVKKIIEKELNAVDVIIVHYE
jgi:O-acetyl-ADP-ribose deacetylase (regulator of RNase III)